MTTYTPSTQLNRKPDLDAAVRRRFVQLGIMVLIQVVALFAAAGRLDWIEGWAYILLYVAFIGLNAALMLRRGKELIAERSEIRKDVKGWDKIVMVFFTILGPGILLVAGFDERFGSSPVVALWLEIAAFIVMVLGYSLFSWAMASNLYFSAMVRIQADRDHRVATNGPYRFVRHPGYIGIIVYTLASSILLGSLWSLIPAILMGMTIVARTALEDRTLLKELDGYQEYAQHVRYRLLPGLW